MRPRFHDYTFGSWNSSSILNPAFCSVSGVKDLSRSIAEVKFMKGERMCACSSKSRSVHGCGQCGHFDGTCIACPPERGGILTRDEQALHSKTTALISSS